MKYYKATNINWDTDEEDIDLPSEVEFEMEDDEDPSLNGADAISDKIGWCVNSFSFERIYKIKDV